MKRLHIIIILIFSGIRITLAQELLPFATSSYAGISGVQLQPASIADSRLKFDMAYSSSSFTLTNTYIGIKKYALMHRTVFDNSNFEDLYITKNTDDKAKSFFMSLRQDIFSFMITLSRKDAIAITPSIRAIANIDNVGQDLLNIIDNGVNDNILNMELTNADVNIQANAFIDLGFTYSRVILDKQKHFLKAGATIKLLQGLGSAYAFGNDINYRFINKDSVVVSSPRLGFGISENFDNDLNYKFISKQSVGFDFGIVYEYRPEWMDYTYEMDGVKNIWRRDQEKYLLKIGFSIMDIGKIRYAKNPNSINFAADNPSFSDNTTTSINDFSDINQFIKDNFTPLPTDKNYFINLPTAISMQADLRLAKGLYFNFMPYLVLKPKVTNDSKETYLSAINFIPRYENKYLGISVPIQYNSFRETNIGLGLRLGPIWLGSNNILSMLLSSKGITGTSASLVIKMPIFYGEPKDKDKDHVSDKKDKCPDVFGVFELQGCPDRDGDGVTDADDKCPDIPGLIEFQGCPDKDGDGIIDENDSCPDVKGLMQYKGCPDSDGDGIIDQNDACPFDAGPASLQGCPDTDGDGIPDKDDKCPTVAGTADRFGCPFIDTDNDGIEDAKDLCPTVKGPPENQGCPYEDSDNDGIPNKDDACPYLAGLAIFKGCPDTDNDGIPDNIDKCPTIAGVVANEGCPEIKKEEEAIIRKAFENLEFETGKAVIRKVSFPSLSELATVLLKRPEFILVLSGHTDNVGNPKSNMTLSKNRTMAVKNFLVKGIDSNRIRTEWFGQEKPIAPNTTPEGRQKNRRVEMKIVFE